MNPSSLRPVEQTTDRLLSKLMSASQLRSRVIAGNIANQNTPGYTRREVRFEERLLEALEGGSDIEATDPEIVLDNLSPARSDGNNVNLEVELNAMRENRILYETFASIVEGRGNIKRAALGGSN